MLLKWLNVGVLDICTYVKEEQLVNIFELSLWLQMLLKTLLVLVYCNFKELYER